MLGAGTVINPIIKIVTTVAILAAVGFFIVRPILDTTEEISNSVNENIRNAQAGVTESLSAAELQSRRSTIASYISSLSSWPAAAREVRSCARRAGEDPVELERCVDFGQGLAHGVLSDRGFATSYADSLRAQGETGAAARVDECVDEAGFKAQAMSRCRELADELLFG